jgi:hypothetical protein
MPGAHQWPPLQTRTASRPAVACKSLKSLQSGQALGKHGQPLHGTGGRRRLVAAGVVARAGKVSAGHHHRTDHHQGGRVLPGAGPLPRVPGCPHQRPRPPGGPWLGAGLRPWRSPRHQQHRSARRITAPMPQARLAPALQKQLVGAIVCWAFGGNALHVPQPCPPHRARAPAIQPSGAKRTPWACTPLRVKVGAFARCRWQRPTGPGLHHCSVA